MRIGIDVDDVLFETTKNWINFYNETYNGNIKYEEQIIYDIAETEEESTRLFDEFCRTHHFLKMTPIDGSIEAITKLNKEHELIVITSRRTIIEKETYNAIRTYFGTNIKQIFMTGNHRGDKTRTTKKQICKQENCEMIIEDAYHHAIHCAENGIKVLLYNRPWNQEKKENGKIIRVNNWKEISEIIQNHELP